MGTAIEAATEAFRNALLERDGPAAGGLYAERAVLVAPGGELLEGREAIARFWQAGIEIGITSFELCPIMTHQRGALAYQLGRYRWQVSSSEPEPASDQGAYLVILEHTSGNRWRRVIDFFDSSHGSLGGPATHPFRCEGRPAEGCAGASELGHSRQSGSRRGDT